MTLQKFRNKLLDEGFSESVHVKHRFHFTSGRGVRVVVDLAKHRHWVYINYNHVGYIGNDWECLCALILLTGAENAVSA